MKRVVALWLPFFATDRLTRPGKDWAGWRETPMATTIRAEGAMRVAAANGAAQAAGVAAELALADALALCPGLKTLAGDAGAEAAALTALAEWCQIWSPWTAPIPAPPFTADEGIWIDATGCAHLFGGEGPMVWAMVSRIEGLGYAVQAGMADTPGAAWAAARFSGEKVLIIPEGAARQVLAGFPVAALRLDLDLIQSLRRLGIRRLADLIPLPRASLAARFGTMVLTRLDQLLGRTPEPLSPLEFREPLAARLAFHEPIGRTEDVTAAILLLATELGHEMEQRSQGARRLCLRLFRVDGEVSGRYVGTAAPVRDPAHLARLFAEGLDGLDAGFGIEVMTLTVTSADSLTPRQVDLEARPNGTALPLLVDRLSRRLGPGRVHAVTSRPTFWPERLCAKAAPLSPGQDWPELPLRPVRLGPRPAPVVVSEDEGRPVRLEGRTDLVSVQGPERIETEWWLQPGMSERGRDYWRVESEDGARLWLFKELGSGRWFIHGSFG